jgi:nucleotide-binding universal stress UspA family protein
MTWREFRLELAREGLTAPKQPFPVNWLEGRPVGMPPPQLTAQERGADMERREERGIEITRILLATDYSSGAEAAVVWAKELSRRLNAEVTVVHVVDPRQLVPEPRLASQAQLDRVAGEFARARTLLLDGSPGEMIVRAGDNADLVVMGTHGRTGVKRMVMGSVAEYVVRNCRKPVLTVRMKDVAAPAA